MDSAATAQFAADAKSVDEQTGSNDQEDTVVDVSRKDLEISPFESSSPSDGMCFHRDTIHLIPGSVGRLEGLKTSKFFSDEIDILPSVAVDLSDLECLPVNFSVPRSVGKLKSSEELELCAVPPRPLAFSMLGEITSLHCLTKLSICHVSIRYIPPEIGCLKKLVELDLSFNKLKSLPTDIAELNALKSLRVANNKLVDLPIGISSLRRLENLDLSNNRLASLAQLKLASMQNLQYLNLQRNNIRHSCQIPPWIFCKLEGNGQHISNDEKDRSVIEVDVPNMAIYRGHGNRSSNGCHIISSCFYPEGSTSCRCSLIPKIKKGWKHRAYLQQRARQERLNYSRNWIVDDHSDYRILKMGEEDESCESTILCKGQSELRFCDEIEKLMDCPAVDLSCSVDGAGSVSSGDTLLTLPDCGDDGKKGFNSIQFGIDNSCLTESSSSNKENNYDTESVSNYRLASPLKELAPPDDTSSSDTGKFIVKTKRHCDRDLDNPKPSKFRRHVEDCTSLSCKYSTESFCSIDDHLPDGFYDAGRDRPFISLEEYEQNLCLDSREVILLDRDKDEELDAMASSAQMLLTEGYSLWFCDYKYNDENTVSFVTLNKVGGFLQRMDLARKYAFGKMLVIGSEPPYKVKGLWLFRGNEIPPFVMEECYDMELYQWTKVDINDEAEKERVNAMIEDQEPFEGEALLDAKCFK